MVGKGSARAYTIPAKRASEKEKPMKVELPEYMRDDLKTDESDSAPRRETLDNRDVEEFLFSMLGEGFKLNMEVIRQVLGKHVLLCEVIIPTDCMLKPRAMC
jgi:hypothetical protein